MRPCALFSLVPGPKIGFPQFWAEVWEKPDLKEHITKQGSSMLRFLLVAAQVTVLKHEIFLGVLRYFFDACRTGRVTAFASDLHVARSGIAARFTTVFVATFHYTGAGNVGTGVLLSCCHRFLLHSPGMKRTLGIIAPQNVRK